jgi:copper homeostasis protein (lipoprotein)
MIKKPSQVILWRLFLVPAIISSLIVCTINPVNTQSNLRSDDHTPKTYTGLIPCADCEAQRLVLTLFSDSTFRMRRTYLGVLNGQDKNFYDIGRWVVEDRANLLKLHGNNESMLQFRIQASDRLRMLDTQGNEIQSNLNYELSHQLDVDLVEGPMPLQGMYMYMADAAVFKECWTGNTFSVLIEADHLALERAYLAMRPQPGESIPVAFKGRFVQQMPEPGLPVREHLIVEQFDRILPGKTCTAMTTETELLGTHWYPVQINGNIVTLEPNQLEPYFVLSPKDNHVSGFTGCNRLMGGFESGKESLRFKEMATTKMACFSSGMALEMDFLNVLNTTTSYQTVGNMLELKDADGKVRMRLETRITIID